MKSDAVSRKTQAEELKQQHKYADALRLRLELERLYEREDAGPVEQSLNLNWIAFLGVHSRDLAEAERAARKCVEIYRPVATHRDQHLATYLFMLATVLAEKREFDEAIVPGEEALALFAQFLGESNSFVQYRRKDIERMRQKDTQPYVEDS